VELVLESAVVRLCWLACFAAELGLSVGVVTFAVVLVLVDAAVLVDGLLDEGSLLADEAGLSAWLDEGESADSPLSA
jgi:hypothetical protein